MDNAKHGMKFYRQYLTLTKDILRLHQEVEIIQFYWLRGCHDYLLRPLRIERTETILQN